MTVKAVLKKMAIVRDFNYANLALRSHAFCLEVTWDGLHVETYCS